MTAIVLSGFAGASIAAELGTMVTAEEIEALESLALNPVRFLVLPRLLATVIMMVLLTVIADVVMVAGGWLTGMSLGLDPQVYYHTTKLAVNITSSGDAGQKQVWPVGIEDGPGLVLQGEFPESMDFAPENWISLEEIP